MLGLLVCTIALGAVSAASGHYQNDPRDSTNPSRYLFIFGDSYTTTGYNVSLQPQPSLDNPLGNPAYPGGIPATFSGGENWVDIVVYNSSLTGTVAYNFAVGSNTVNSSRVQSGSATAPPPIQDFRDQQAEFAMLAKNTSVKWSSTNSIFISWFGINDVAVQVFQGRNYSVSTSILNPDVNDYFGLLSQQYGLGARNFITILVPPIYRAPIYGYGTGSTSPAIKNLTQYWNNLIKDGNSRFKRQYSNVRSNIVDPSPTFTQILDNPQQYGAPNSTCYNYPEGQPCLWRDFIHVGLVIQREFGKVMAQAVQSISVM